MKSQMEKKRNNEMETNDVETGFSQVLLGDKRILVAPAPIKGTV